MIRAYRQADLDALLGLFHRSVHALGAADYTPEQLAAWAPELPDRRAWAERLAAGATMVAERDGDIAGFIRTGDCGYVDLLYVDPHWARRGVASTLLAHALDRLRAQGVDYAWCHASLTARPFFEHHGFAATARRTVERNGVEMINWAMQRELSGAADTNP